MQLEIYATTNKFEYLYEQLIVKFQNNECEYIIIIMIKIFQLLQVK